LRAAPYPCLSWTPAQSHLTVMSFELKAVGEKIDKLSEYLKNAKPRWKKMWEKELQDIVAEQKLVKEQDAVLQDYDDLQHKLESVFEQLILVRIVGRRTELVLSRADGVAMSCRTMTVM